jgi:hypothetical protein
MSIKRVFDAVERRGDIGRRVVALVLPISNRPRVTSSCAGKIGLRESGEHPSGPNLASRDNVAHNPILYTILETPPLVIPPCRKQAPTYAIMLKRRVGPRHSLTCGECAVVPGSCGMAADVTLGVKGSQSFATRSQPPPLG